MLKVAIIQKLIPQYRLDFYKALYEQGKDYGMDVLVFASETATPQCEFPVCKLPASYPFGEQGGLFWMRGLKKSVEGSDVVIAPQELSGLAILWLWMIRKTFCKSWIWWGHGYHTKVGFSTGTRRRAKEVLRNFLTLRGDGIITYTQAGADYCRQRGVDVRRALPYFNTIGVEKLRKVGETISKSEIEETKEKFGVGVKKVLLYCGRLIPRKQARFLLKSFAELKNRMPDVVLFIIGDGPERKELDELHIELNLQDVSFLGEMTDDSREFSLFFRMADVFVLPGTVGLNIVHAFAYGLPIVTTQQKHSVEIEYLIDKENGMVTPFDEKVYAEEIANLLNSPHRLQAMRQHAWEKGNQLLLEKSAFRFLHAIREISAFKDS